MNGYLCKESNSPFKLLSLSDKKFSHLNAEGNPKIVDVSEKSDTLRIAKAKAEVYLPTEIVDRFENDDIKLAKGPVFHTAILAGIMASKKTSELIPLCHPLPLHKCDVGIKVMGENRIEIICTAKTTGKTGVEMEALTGASVAALTIYDMCKGFSHEIEIRRIYLVEKKGGKSTYEKA